MPPGHLRAHFELRRRHRRGALQPLTVEQLFNSIYIATRGGEKSPDRMTAPVPMWWGWYAGQMNLVYGPGIGWTEVSPLPGNARQMLLVRNGEIIQNMIRNPGGTANLAAQMKGSPVEKVDFITSVGHGDGPGTREKLGLRGKGPTKVISDLGILEPDPDTKELVLTHLHEGVTTDQAQQATGWDLQFADDLQTTEPPTEEELRALRELVNA